MDILLLSVIGLLVLIALTGVKIVPQSQEYVVEQFGKYTVTLPAGLNFIVPVLNRVASKVSILERQLQPQQISVITKDNVEIHLTAAVFFRIIDAAKSVYRITDIDAAVKTTVTSIVRSTGGQMEFDEIQSKREFISEKIQASLSEACAIWGIDITRTEILDVSVDDATRLAMQQQLNAERERRAAVTKAEGDRQAQQLRADGDLYTAQKQAEARRVLADAEAYATTQVGTAIQASGQPAIDFEIMKQQIHSITDLAKSPNSKLLVIPTDVTKSLGGLAVLLETLRAK
ncbi:MAG: SPFH domain-containing protein [Alphaproteobacteria bacterium]|nr:SPFH domain-containing protein [Alphaproteobacteria bacterium]MDP1671243.1 SPFH domain-containing protein [Alphaproteobacteria bacterium]